MQTQTFTTLNNNDEVSVRSIYESLLKSWNDHNADQYADLFMADGSVVGFDGSQMNGREEIKRELAKIFADHKVASYVSIIREIRPLSSTVFLLRAVAGMIPQGKTEINPVTNAIQTLVAQKHENGFLISFFQNTPAAFHGRPQLSQQLTEELQEATKKQ